MQLAGLTPVFAGCVALGLSVSAFKLRPRTSAALVWLLQVLILRPASNVGFRGLGFRVEKSEATSSECSQRAVVSRLLLTAALEGMEASKVLDRSDLGPIRASGFIHQAERIS